MNRRKFFTGLFALPFVGLVDKLVPKIRTQELRQGIINAHIGMGLRLNGVYVRRKDGKQESVRVTPGKVIEVSEPYTYNYTYGVWKELDDLEKRVSEASGQCHIKIYRTIGT